MSSESLVSLKDQSRERLQATIQYVEVEAVFNSHGSVADAELSAAQIMPNSVVFTEGVYLGTEPEEDKLLLSDIVTRLGFHRIENGVDSDSYAHYKQGALGIIGELLASLRADDADPQALWQATMYLRLVEKDCLVFKADLSKRELRTDQHEELDEILPTNTIGLMTDVDPVKSLRRTFLDSRIDLRKFVVSQSMRESICVAGVVGTLNNLFEYYPVDVWQLATTPGNRLQVYTIWGTAHAHSLSQKLSEQGFQTSTNILGDTDHVDFDNPDLDLGLEDVPYISLANMLFLALISNPFHRSGVRALDKLIVTVRESKNVPATAPYIRAYQLCISTHNLMEQLSSSDSEEEKAQIFSKIQVDTLNLSNLLSELGFDAGLFLEDSNSEIDDA